MTAGTHEHGYENCLISAHDGVVSTATHSKAKRQDSILLRSAKGLSYEAIQAVRTKVEPAISRVVAEMNHTQFLTIRLLLLLGQAILGLRHLKFAMPLERDTADSQVRTAEIKRKEFALLLACRPLLLSGISQADDGLTPKTKVGTAVSAAESLRALSAHS